MMESMTGGGAPPNRGGDAPEKPVPLAEFEGFAQCALFSEKAKITVDRDGLLVAALFDQLPIPYGEVTAFSLAAALEGKIKGSRIAHTYPWLYDLCGGTGLTVGAKPAPEKKDQPEAAVPNLPSRQELPQGVNLMMGMSPPGQEEPAETGEK